MDKNMINIDDLVRQRLSGGEEAIMPDSWSRMKELLDKEKPEKRVAGFAWRRIYGIITGLLLVSALTVGSYHLVNSISFRENNANETGNGFSKSTNSNRNYVSGNFVNQERSPISGKNNVKNSSLNSRNSPGENVTLRTDKEKTHATSVRMPVAASHARTPNGPSAKVAALNQKPQKTPSDKQTVKETGKTRPAASGVNIALNYLPEHQQNIPPAQNNNQEEKADRIVASSQESINPAQEKNSEPLQPVFSEPLASNEKAKETPDWVKAPVDKEKQDEPFFLKKDTIQKLTILQRYIVNPINFNKRLISDTISIEEITISKPSEKALAKRKMTLKEKAIEKAEVIPGSKKPELAAAEKKESLSAEQTGSPEALVPLSDFKVNSRKTQAWNSKSFDEVMRDVKFSLAQTRFYPGVSGGVNSYLFGPNNLGGIQLGLFGLFTFGENWGALAELKYIHRFNNGSTIKDNYKDISGAQGNYLEKNVLHFFKFSALPSIEMPLALRYAAGRVNVLGGINFAYHFAVNAEEATYPDSSYRQSINPDWTNSKPSVTYEDFNARFSVGGVIGLSYDISPSMQMDFRATKNFWDNASGSGAQKVSQELYRTPSFQISLFYRFSQRNQIPKPR